MDQFLPKDSYMITKLSLHNFKTFLNADVELTRRHLFVGKNNSGKSNFCLGLRFLAATAGLDYDVAITAVSGGVDGLCHWALDPIKPESKIAALGCTAQLVDNDRVLEYDYRLELQVNKPSQQPSPGQSAIQTSREQLTVSMDGFIEPLKLIGSDGVNVAIFNETGDRTADPIETSRAPIGSSMLSKLYDSSANHMAILFKLFLTSFTYHALSPPLLRFGWTLPNQSQVLSARASLAAHGHNLPFVLFQLKNEDEPRYRRILETLSLLEPR